MSRFVSHSSRLSRFSTRRVPLRTLLKLSFISSTLRLYSYVVQICRCAWICKKSRQGSRETCNERDVRSRNSQEKPYNRIKELRCLRARKLRRTATTTRDDVVEHFARYTLTTRGLYKWKLHEYKSTQSCALHSRLRCVSASLPKTHPCRKLVNFFPP